MKREKIQLCVVIVSFWGVFNTKAQINYEIFTDIGYSNFIERDKDLTINVGNSYTGLSFFSVGTEVLFPVKENFILASGLTYALLSAENNASDDIVNAPNYTGAIKWKEKLHTLSIPVKFGFKLEDWVRAYTGVSNTFYLDEPDEMSDKEIKIYTLSFIGGVDFIIKEHFIVGASYCRDLTPMSELLQLPSTTETYNIKYYATRIGVKLGYIFGK